MTGAAWAVGLLRSEWPAPANVRTAITTRLGGCSEGPFASNNMAFHVGDQPGAVAANRQGLLSSVQGLHSIQWLQQVHGTAVVDATGQADVEADGCLSDKLGVGCAVMTADCLPVLLCDRRGTQVSAVHAGWRGLAAGILPTAVARFTAPAEEILVYLGPAISQTYFEVGQEVKAAFTDSHVAERLGAEYQSSVPECFNAGVEGRYYADLYSIARQQCIALGISAVFGGAYCTFRDADLFYSYRREVQTGRMASLIWLHP